MKIIHKYPLNLERYQDVILPVGAMILSITNQRGRYMLWAEVNIEQKQGAPRRIFILPTGSDMMRI